jgi:hypothetical protein
MNNAKHQAAFKAKEKDDHKRWQRSTAPLTQGEWDEVKKLIRAVILRRNNI